MTLEKPRQPISLVGCLGSECGSAEGEAVVDATVGNNS